MTAFQGRFVLAFVCADRRLFTCRAPELEGTNNVISAPHNEFTNAAPGLPIPDFEQLLFAPEAGQAILSVTFQGSATGHFPDGRPGTVHVIEKAILDHGFHGALSDGFPAEFINLIH